jgi:uncharacterized membrane protein
MTAITAPTTVESTESTERTDTRRPSWRSGLLTALAAAVVTTVVALAGVAAGVPMEIGGEEIPVLGYGQMVVLWSIVGLVIARQMANRAGHPRSTFVRTTVALTLLSCVPSVMTDATVATQAVLVLTHLVAAAVVIPRLASDLDG